MSQLCAPGARVSMSHIHDLHRAVQTSFAMDALAPIGAFKLKPSGTTALRTSGEPTWHDYALPHHVPPLMDQWLAALHGHIERCDGTGASTRARTRALAAYTELHLGLVAIHPYADGNGRMARLIANLPVLRAGLPPILIDATQRRRYLTLAGDVSLSRGAPVPGTPLVRRTAPVHRMRELFAESWQSTLDLIDTYHARQAERGARIAQVD
jgi:hypothetical protein